MISDVLGDAVGDIDSYLNDPAFNKVYAGELREIVLKLRADMLRVRAILDTPPPGMQQSMPAGLVVKPGREDDSGNAA